MNLQGFNLKNHQISLFWLLFTLTRLGIVLYYFFKAQLSLFPFSCMTFYKRKYSQDLDELPNKRSCTEDQDPIKQFSSDQRLAVGDEPVCYICGKYGEYINNDTDQDVCR